MQVATKQIHHDDTKNELEVCGVIRSASHQVRSFFPFPGGPSAGRFCVPTSSPRFISRKAIRRILDCFSATFENPSDCTPTNSVGCRKAVAFITGLHTASCQRADVSQKFTRVGILMA